MKRGIGALAAYLVLLSLVAIPVSVYNEEEYGGSAYRGEIRDGCYYLEWTDGTGPTAVSPRTWFWVASWELLECAGVMMFPLLALLVHARTTSIRDALDQCDLLKTRRNRLVGAVIFAALALPFLYMALKTFAGLLGLDFPAPN